MNRHLLLAIAAATFVSHNPAFAQDPSTSAEQRAELEASGREEFAQMGAFVLPASNEGSQPPISRVRSPW